MPLKGNKSTIDQIFLLRAIACLSVVLLHSIDYTVENYAYFLSADNYLIGIYDSTELLLKFGTPTFIFISELLLAYSYNKGTPPGFLKKRLKFVFIPYISMAVFYAIFSAVASGNVSSIGAGVLNNVFGGFHGYFVLVIFQFYFLHMIYSRYAHKFNGRHVLLASFIANVIYLSVFHFTSAPIPGLEEFWARGNWLLFFGWIFYFFLAFYCGRNYEAFVSFIKNNRPVIFLLSFATMLLVLTVYHLDIISTSTSKRPDMVLLTTSLIFAIYAIGLSIKKVPNLLIMISRYSFGIYLLHVFYLQVLFKVLQMVPFNLYGFSSFILFGISVGLSMATIYITNLFPFGKFIVGNIGNAPPNTKEKKQVPA